MMSACFATLPAFAYVDVSESAEEPNTVYATIAKSNITAWTGNTTATVENGQYKLVSTGNAYPTMTVKAPQVDAGEYLNVVVEMSVPAMSGKKGYVTCVYSDETTAIKGVYPKAHTDGEFVTVTATFDAKEDATIDAVKFQPYGEQSSLATADGNCCLIRSIKFVKSIPAEDKVWDGTFETYGSAEIATNAELPGGGAGTAVTSPEGYFGLKMSSVSVSTSTYKYAVVEMYVEKPTGTSKLGTYPLYQPYSVQHSDNTWSNAWVNLYPGQEGYGYDLSGDHRQAYVYDTWQTYVFPLVDNYNGAGLQDGDTVSVAYINLSSYAYSQNIYIKSVKYTAEAPQSENITITPKTEGITLGTVTGMETFTKTVFDDKYAWKIGDGTDASGGSVKFSGNISVPVASYNYVLVNCYYSNGTKGAYPSVRITSSKNSGIKSWYSLYSYQNMNDISKANRAGRNVWGGDGVWLTIIFPIANKNVISESDAFSTSDYITSFVFDAHANGGKGGDVYVSSITFSATPVAVQDKSVSEAESIMFRGAQNPETASEGEASAFRLIATLGDVDLSAYSKVGFELVGNATAKYEGTTVYSSIFENTDGNIAEVKATDYKNGKYIVAVEIEVPTDASGEFTVKPYLVDNNGETVYGIAAKITVTNGTVTGCVWEVA